MCKGPETTDNIASLGAGGSSVRLAPWEVLVMGVVEP